MKRFSFRLERVLELKRQVEKRKKQELAQELQQELSLQRHRRRLSSQIERYYHELRKLQRGSFKPAETQGYYSHVFFLERKRREVGTHLQRQQRQVVTKRAELVSASRERRLLESVRERRLQEYRKELKRAEAAFLDEMATTRYLWRQREG